ncbi:MAG: DNA primase catalytic subunit PriS [Methanobacteriota archaeon]|nr:MAG: DNA primase catalytic subunit PriS [Euryarchaeota archaeon]
MIAQLFSQYYERAKFPILSIEQREFGAGWRSKIDKRHMSFFTEAEFRHFLVEESPLYVSHSTAYYEKPSAPMGEKGWKGADLVFDMDGDVTSEASLKPVLDNTIELRDLLRSDLGIKKMLFVFSGNRGFHIHVRDEEFRSLDGDARKAIVEYVLGKGFDYRLLFNKGSSSLIEGPKPTDRGYRGRFARKAIEMVKDNPSSIYKGLNGEAGQHFISGIMEGVWSRIKAKEPIERFSAIAKALEITSIAADGAVTYDVKKLIRVPNSLHGSTGLRVLPMKNLEDFSVSKALAFSEDKVKVRFTTTFSYETLLGKLAGKEGESQNLPLYVAVFLACQGKAKIEP